MGHRRAGTVREVPTPPRLSALPDVQGVRVPAGTLELLRDLVHARLGMHYDDSRIDFLKDRAVFSIFRRSSEMPLYRIEKDPRLARKQGAYSVISATGLIVKRGHELDNVLRAVDKSLKLVAT